MALLLVPRVLRPAKVYISYSRKFVNSNRQAPKQIALLLGNDSHTTLKKWLRYSYYQVKASFQ